jgi:hypothetical protein
VTSGVWPSTHKKYGKELSRNIHAHFNQATKESYVHFISAADKKKSLQQAKKHSKKASHTKHGKKTPETTPWAAAIFRSTDGFQTWQQVFSNSTYYMNQISCPTEQVCFAVAENESGQQNRHESE